MLSERPASLGAQPSGGRYCASAIGPSDEPCQEWVSDGVLLRYDSPPFVWCHLDILRPGHWRQQEPLPFRGNCSCKFRARHSVSCFQNIIAELRTAHYARLAPIANHWNAAMGIDVRYPDTQTLLRAAMRLVGSGRHRCRFST